MRSYRAGAGPFREAVRYADHEIEQICNDALRAEQLLPAEPSPVRVERFIEKRFGVHAEYEEMQAGVLGYTRFDSNGPAALFLCKALSEDPSPSAARRLRATVAHEGGHMLLHAHLFALEDLSVGSIFDQHPDFSKVRILCRDEKKSSRPWWEIQANKCIPALLLPKELVSAAMKPFLVPDGRLGRKAIPVGLRDDAARELAHVFDVNPQVVGYRLDALYPEGNGQLTF